MCVLDEEYNRYKIQAAFNDESAVYYFFKLIFGILTAFLSLLWVAQLVSYFLIPIGRDFNNGPPGYPLINLLLITLNEVNLSFIATMIFSIMCLYLLLCVVKGCIKFGIRFILCFEIHPLVKGETYLNSILFNVNLVLITSISVTQFCSSVFKEYATMSDIDLIFAYQIKYLRFFEYFFKYHVFEYLFIGLIFVSFIYLICRPNDINSVERELEKRKKEGLLLDNE